MKRTIGFLAVAAVVSGSVLFALPAFAASSVVQTGAGMNVSNNRGPGMARGMSGQRVERGLGKRGMSGKAGIPALRPAVVGTVVSVSGTTLVVSGHQGFASSSPLVSYTVNAAGAKVTKDNATSTLSAVVVGDTVSVTGAINGTSITAQVIRDGVQPTRVEGNKEPKGLKGAKAGLKGNGSPARRGNAGQPQQGILGGIKNFFGKVLGSK